MKFKKRDIFQKVRQKLEKKLDTNLMVQRYSQRS